jgi:hypothetical protein
LTSTVLARAKVRCTLGFFPPAPVIRGLFDGHPKIHFEQSAVTRYEDVGPALDGKVDEHLVIHVFAPWRLGSRNRRIDIRFTNPQRFEP